MAADIDSALVQFMADTSEVTAIVGSDPFRWFEEAAPQDIGDQDHVVYQLISHEKQDHLGGVIPMCTALYEFRCVSRKNSIAKALAKAIRKAKGGAPTGRKFEEFAGTLSDIKIHRIKIENRRSTPMPPAAGEEAPRWRERVLDVEVTYDEED